VAVPDLHKLLALINITAEMYSTTLLPSLTDLFVSYIRFMTTAKEVQLGSVAFHTLTVFFTASVIFRSVPLMKDLRTFLPPTGSYL
jgi:hypothetical protein